QAARSGTCKRVGQRQSRQLPRAPAWSRASCSGERDARKIMSAKARQFGQNPLGLRLANQKKGRNFRVSGPAPAIDQRTASATTKYTTARAGMRAGRSKARATRGGHATTQAKRCVSALRCRQRPALIASCPTKAICLCPSRSKGRSLRQNRRESGECRMKALSKEVN